MLDCRLGLLAWLDVTWLRSKSFAYVTKDSCPVYRFMSLRKMAPFMVTEIRSFSVVLLAVLGLKINFFQFFKKIFVCGVTWTVLKFSRINGVLAEARAFSLASRSYSHLSWRCWPLLHVWAVHMQEKEVFVQVGNWNSVEFLMLS